MVSCVGSPLVSGQTPEATPSDLPLAHVCVVSVFGARNCPVCLLLMFFNIASSQKTCVDVSICIGICPSLILYLRLVIRSI